MQNLRCNRSEEFTMRTIARGASRSPCAASRALAAPSKCRSRIGAPIRSAAESSSARRAYVAASARRGLAPVPLDFSQWTGYKYVLRNDPN